jgi:hypothetical protein
MTGPEKLLDPTGAGERFADSTLAPRPAGLRGLIVGLLDNTKPNAEVLLSKIADELRGRYDVSGALMYTKGYFGTPAEEDMIKQISQDCDLVVAAVRHPVASLDPRSCATARGRCCPTYFGPSES